MYNNIRYYSEFNACEAAGKNNNSQNRIREFVKIKYGPRQTNLCDCVISKSIQPLCSLKLGKSQKRVRHKHNKQV